MQLGRLTIKISESSLTGQGKRYLNLKKDLKNTYDRGENKKALVKADEAKELCLNRSIWSEVSDYINGKMILCVHQ